MEHNHKYLYHTQNTSASGLSATAISELFQ